MKKILFIVNVDWFFVSHRLPIAVAAIEQGYEVHLACGITDKQSMLEAKGLIVHPLSIARSGLGFLGEIKTFLNLFSIIRKVSPDITHCVTIKPVLYGNLLGRILSVPVRISSISGLGFVFIAKGIKTGLLRRVVSLFYRISLKSSKKVIFQNTADRDVLHRIGAITPEQEVFIRGSGVDLHRYTVLPEPSGQVVVMLLARLLIDKGVNEFAEAAKIIKANRSNVKMVLVGDIDPDNPRSVSEQQIQKWIEDGILEHWGYSHNAAKTISQSNIMVLPSYREGLPKCLIEAAACGRAVVTTDAPGCRDAIEVNKTGLLVPVGMVQPLVDAILKLADNQALRNKLALNGRLLAEKSFDINDVVNAHLDIYRT